MVPAAHRLEHLLGPRVSHLFQSGDGGRIVLLAGKDHVDSAGRQRGAVLEKRRIVALHRLQPPRQLVRKCVDVRVAAEQGEAREPRRIVGNLVRLLVGHHLQPVLDAAQKDIGFAEIARDLTFDPPPRGEPAQRLQRLRHAQVRLAPTGDQLLRLHEELDLADAAAAELDVVAGDRDRAEAAVGVDLPLHGVNVGDGRKVEVLAPDEGRKLVEELATGVEIAGAGVVP